MLAKRRLFGALLFMLTLLSSAACAKINLKPYEVPSASGTEVDNSSRRRSICFFTTVR